jgi:hypothetical protein
MVIIVPKYMIAGNIEKKNFTEINQILLHKQNKEPDLSSDPVLR